MVRDQKKFENHCSTHSRAVINCYNIKAFFTYDHNSGASNLAKGSVVEGQLLIILSEKKRFSTNVPEIDHTWLLV